MDGARNLYLNRHPWQYSVHKLYRGSEQWGGSHRKCLVPYLKPQLCSLWSQGVSNCWASSLQRYVSWEPVPWGVAKTVSVLTLWFSVTSWQLEIPSWLHGFPGGSEGKASACNTEDPGSIPGLGRSPGEGNGNPLQYSCLEKPMDGGACRLQSMGSQRVGHDWATSLHLVVQMSELGHKEGWMLKN